jgi:hypothetical protein
MSTVITKTQLPVVHYEYGGAYMGAIGRMEKRTVITDEVTGDVLSDVTVVLGKDASPLWVVVPSAPLNADRDEWDGSQWVENAILAEVVRDNDAAERLNTPILKTLRDVLLDQENRIRALEGRAPVGQTGYTTALRAIVKSYVS